MANDASRIMGDGVPVTLKDGREVKLRYDFRALAVLEQQYGSIDAALDDTDRGTAGPIYSKVMALMNAGLLHDDTVDNVADLLDPLEVNPYSDAIAKALSQAFPETPKEEAASGPPISNGNSSTTLAPSVTGAPIVSSGA